jgi:uncharacterized protein YeaO (DUF488 family)
MFRVKRIYDKPAATDGYRVLVDRLWPRGLSKQQARADLWLREIAPSHELRKQFAHRHERWVEFQQRYATELQGKEDLLAQLRQLERKHGCVTLLFAAKDTRRNNAVALAGFLKKHRQLPAQKRLRRSSDPAKTRLH